MKNDLMIQMQEVFRAVFHSDSLLITDATTAKDISGWDSLTHMELIAALEEHFGITFTFDEVSRFQHVGDLYTLISEKTGNAL